MAASNVPKHDFAPSWLKIPNSSENTRPVGSRNSHTQDRSRQRHDDGLYNRYISGDYPRPLNRQNSFDMYDGSRRYSQNNSSKFRHHSMEDDYYMNYYNYGPYPLAYNEHYPMQFRSQPSLPRQDMKFPSPSSRFGQVNGSYNGFGGFCDFFPPGEGFSNYGGGGHTKRSQYSRDGRAESKESRDSDRSQKDEEEKDNTFNDEFPSLNGIDEDGEGKTSKNASSGGVWDNPPRSKSEESSDSKDFTAGFSLYKVVPTKAQQQSPTQPIEILGKRLVHSKPADKKSQFLKVLRKEADDGTTQDGLGDEDNSHEEDVEEEAQVMKNGVEDLRLDPDPDHPVNGSSKILSSTVEEEIMFMRSLGWDETAETEEITEDEKREFLKKNRQRPLGGMNGRSSILSKPWSPQHQAPTPAQPTALDMNETVSSSDTDSDEDV